MIFLGPLFFSTLVGFLCLANLLARSRMRYPTFLALALSAPWGLGLMSLVLFWAHLFGGAQGKIGTFLIAFPATAALLLRFLSLPAPGLFCSDGIRKILLHFKSRDWKKFSWIRSPQGALTMAAALFFFYALFRFLDIFTSSSVLNPSGGWDARYIWNLKAKFYFRSPEEWTGMFSSAIAFSHPDYPLLVPGAVAWGWNWIGHEALVWPAVVSLVFSLSVTFLILWYLASYVSWTAGFLAGGFFLFTDVYRFWAPLEYADIPLCFYMSAAALLLVSAVRGREKNLFLLSGLASGMAAWTKNEGLVFTFWLGTLAALFFMRAPEIETGKKKSCLGFFIAGLLLPLAAVGTLKIFLATSGDYLGSGRTVEEYYTGLFGDVSKTVLIFKSLFYFLLAPAHWNGLWIFFFSAVVAGWFFKRKEWAKDPGWIPMVLVGLVFGSYFLILHMTPHEIQWQISTALTRLLLHPGVLALVFAFETLSHPESEGSQSFPN